MPEQMTDEQIAHCHQQITFMESALSRQEPGYDEAIQFTRWVLSNFRGTLQALESDRTARAERDAQHAELAAARHVVTIAKAGEYFGDVDDWDDLQRAIEAYDALLQGSGEGDE